MNPYDEIRAKQSAQKARGVDYNNKIHDLTQQTGLSGVDYNNSNNSKNRNNSNTAFTSSSLSSSRESQKQETKAKENTEERCIVISNEGVSGCEEENQSFAKMVKRAPIHFWENEGTTRKYKVSIRVNFENGQNLELIANLTKDFRNFKKHIPEESYDETVQFMDNCRSELKQHHIKPWMGKFRSKLKGKSRKGSVVEPYTSIAVWYNQTEKIWHGLLQIYDWMYDFEFQTEQLTASQVNKGCKGYDLYTNQALIKKGQTWAEKSGFNFKGNK